MMYVVPRCDKCKRLFMEHATRSKPGTTDALRWGLAKLHGWQATSAADYCPVCIAELRRGGGSNEPNRVAR